MIKDSRLVSRFESIHRHPPEWIARAPGRVNLIGEHTDYNGGFVLPAAINREIAMACRVRTDHQLRLYAGNFSEGCETRLDAPLQPVSRSKWANYFLAVVNQFQQRGVVVPGMDVYLEGDIPVGSGLSSSAAFEVCVATAISELENLEIDRSNLARLAQAAEHSRFVNVRCGIMDQFVSALGEEDRVLFIDCHDLGYDLVPFDSSSAVIVIINSMKQRGLMDSAYNQRRQECETGLAELARLSGMSFPSLRHVPMGLFEEFAGALDNSVMRRVRHNVMENQRVITFVEALRTSDWKRAGEQLYSSHASLRDDFEVSCHELDVIVEIAREMAGVFGCRMTGAGFGGCAVALVEPGHVQAFEAEFARKYEASTGLKPDIYVTPPSAGSRIKGVTACLTPV